MTDIGVVARPTTDGGGEVTRGTPQARRPLVRRAWSWGIRRPVAASALVALVARVGFALVSFAVNHTAFVPDELQYLQLSRIIADGGKASDWFSGADYAEALYRTTYAFTGTLMWLTRLFWPSRLVGQLLAVACGTATVGLTARLALEFVGRKWALVAGLIAALLPSQILWSSIAIRESMVWLGLVAVALGAVLASQPSWRRVVSGTLMAAAALLLLGYLRDQTMVAAGWSFMLAAPLAGRAMRFRRSALALLVILVVPYLGGTGWGGYTYLDHGFGVLAVQRAYLSVGANTAVVPTTVVPTRTRGTGLAEGLRVKGVPGPVPPGFSRGGSTTTKQRRGGGPARHGKGGAPRTVPSGGVPTTENVSGSEDVSTAAGANPAVDDRPTVDNNVLYTPRGAYLADNALSSNIAWLPKGTVATLFRPWLWESSLSTSMSLARLENVLWLGIYALAIAGAWLGRRQWRRLAVVVGMTVALVGEAAVSQGNLGTAFRHRGQIVWALAVLVALAGQAWSDRRTAEALTG